MYGCMWGSWLVRMSPIIFTGIRSPDIFFLTLRALQRKSFTVTDTNTAATVWQEEIEQGELCKSNVHQMQMSPCWVRACAVCVCVCVCFTAWCVYFSSLMLHMMSSFQFTKIMATSFSVSSSHSSRGLWKICIHTHTIVWFYQGYRSFPACTRPRMFRSNKILKTNLRNKMFSDETHWTEKLMCTE